MKCAELRLLTLAAALLAGCASAPASRSAPEPAAKKPAATSTAKAPAAAAAAQGTKAPSAAAAATPAAAAPEPTDPYAKAIKLMRSSPQEAEAALLAQAKDNPQASGPQTNLGILYAKSNRKPEARAAFTRAIAINPKNSVALNWLGVLAREANEYAKAESSYKAALDADPTNVGAQLNLAILYDLYLKRPAEALAAYRKYEQMTGKKDARASVWISELQAAQGTPAAAPAAKPAPKPAQGGTTS